MPEKTQLPSDEELTDLRVKHYNGTVIERLDIHEDLARFRIRPDAGVPDFEPGQYVALGLGYWEDRLPGTQAEDLPDEKVRKVVKRAYSISCPVLDDRDRLLPCSRCDYLEFYVTLIRSSEQPPALTPRLFNLAEGDRLFVQPRVVGAYTLAGVQPDDDVVLLATGTGEAPHNAMATELLARGHRGKIVVATCARYQADFGYLKEHDVLCRRFENYVYLTYTTREARNLDPGSADYVGVERLQTVYETGRLAREANFELRPDSTHVFLCGNPAMIGLSRPNDPPLEHPGMLQLLIRDGFQSLYPVGTLAHMDAEQAAKATAAEESLAAGVGVIRFEKYW